MKHWFKIVLKLSKTKTAINEEFYQQNKRLSIRQIAVKVATKLADNGISGRGGKPLTAENIRREALIGLKLSKNLKIIRESARDSIPPKLKPL